MNLHTRPIACHVTLGNVEMTIEDLGNLRVGQVIQMETFADDQIELAIGGKIKVDGSIVQEKTGVVFLMKGEFYE